MKYNSLSSSREVAKEAKAQLNYGVHRVRCYELSMLLQIGLADF